MFFHVNIELSAGDWLVVFQGELIPERKEFLYLFTKDETRPWEKYVTTFHELPM